MESRHVKSISIDERSKRRIKFASAKERAKRASADVYRSHKRKIGATSASTREIAVHNPRRENSARKRQRAHHQPVDNDKGKTAVLKISKNDDDEILPLVAEEEGFETLDAASSLAEELDETLDRNASEIFGKFHRQVWPLVRSLPEILHHAGKIVDLMLTHLLSPESSPERPSDPSGPAGGTSSTSARGFIVNHATLDILHLTAVLARDLRYEIHPYLDKILARIIQDLLNPPPPPPESGKQPIPLDVTVVEAAFRCISYTLRYDADKIVENIEGMRKYYGVTLAARRELSRRLAAESFAPLIRKLKSQMERQRHLKRVFKALIAAMGGHSATPQFQRAQDDAVDGIALLLFHVVRGVPGRLHSQGSPTVRFIISFCTKSLPTANTADEGTGCKILLSIACNFLNRLCRHVDEGSLRHIVRILSTVLNASLSPDMIAELGFEPALNVLTLLSKSFENARISLLRGSSQESSELYKALDGIFEGKYYSLQPARIQEEVVSLICPVLLALQADDYVGERLATWLNVIFKTDPKSPNRGSIRNITEILARDLIPKLSERTMIDQVGSASLSAAAQTAQHESDSALLTLFSLASKQFNDEELNNDSNFSASGCLFPDSGRVSYKINEEAHEKLVDHCLVDLSYGRWQKTNFEKVALIIRCVPFVAMLQLEDGSENRLKVSFRKASAWLADVVSSMGKLLAEEGAKEKRKDLVLVTALGLEGLSHLAVGFLDADGNTAIVQKVVGDLIETVEYFLLANPASMWAVRGVAAFVDVLSRLGKRLNEKCDETFGALLTNLSSPSHALRLHTLQILASYPMKNFVTDHADLDLDEDLDEEPSFRPQNEQNRDRKTGPVGKCDIIATMLQIEKMRIRLTEERSFLNLVSRVEVLGRSGKLPVIYAEAAAHHMLGLFYVKFALLWPVAGRSLIALVKEHENAAWPALEAKLVSVMKPPSRPSLDQKSDGADAKMSVYTKHYISCIEWEESQGRSMSAFGSIPTIQDGEVYRHLTTDESTVIDYVWEVAEKCQHQVAKHSRVIVPTFLEFLSGQYFSLHADDPSAKELCLKDPGGVSSAHRSMFHKYDLQKKLQCFLRVFAAIDGPQQLVDHQLLEKVFRAFLTHQETRVVHLALSALMKFKPKHLVPYGSLVSGLLEKGRLRNAILKFQEAIDAGKVEPEHRGLLVPIVSRILFGRLAVRESRSAKDSPAAKRAAIMAFLSILCPEDDELFPFIYLMTRSFIPQHKQIKELESHSSEQRDHILSILSSVTTEDIDLPSTVVEGFLHLLQAVVAQLGHRIKQYVPALTSIVMAILRLVAVGKERNEINAKSASEEGEGDLQEGKDKIRRGAVRTLCFQRLSEMFTMYASVIDFKEFGTRLWDATAGSVMLLPEMVVKAERVPAFLQMLETLSSDHVLAPLLSIHEPVIISVTKCIASTSQVAVMKSVLSIIENLLESASSDPSSAGMGVVTANVPLLLEQFTNRLKGNADSEQLPHKAELFKGSRRTLRQATWRKELQILCRISNMLGEEKHLKLDEKGAILEDLSELLLPFLEPGQGTSDDDRLNVLGILKSTVGNLQYESSVRVFAALSDYLGPNKSKAGIESLPVRKEIAEVLTVAGKKCVEFNGIAQKVARMSANNTKRVDEVDFEIVIPELNALGKGNTGCEWALLGDEAPLNLAPIISTCFHYLHNEDGVIARASFNALKTLVGVASMISKTSKADSSWIKLVESLVVPRMRSGLQARNVSVRRFYVLIIREASMCFREHGSPNLCGDLNALIDVENPDLDFFVGVTHVQVHRRGRAFQRLRKTLKEDGASGKGLTSQSLSSVLLPLAMHPAYECKTKAEESFALEGIATVGAITRYLPWNKYQNVVGSILSSFDRHPEQERYLVGALCAIIDSFHFELLHTDERMTDDDDDGKSNETSKTAVWRALERRIVPKLEGLLTKEKVERNGTKTKIIRPPIVLALMKLFQKFPEEFFESKLPHILTVMCDALRSRDSDARDLARNTMAKLVTGMSLKYLSDVVRELTITLNEGYKLHVRTAVIHTILQELLSTHKPPERASAQDAAVDSFDLTIPAMMDILQEDLFGEANERRESQETNVRYVKEAGGSKGVHSVEMICRMLRFRPSDAKEGSIVRSSVHCVVSPLLERLRLPDATLSNIRKIKEILLRVVIGLSHNPSVVAEELFPFVYATIQPFISSQTISTVLDDDDEDVNEEAALKVSGSRDTATSKATSKSGKVVEWRPSSLQHAKSSQVAIVNQRKERQELLRVRDGASAPKLTGTGRHGSLDVSDVHGMNDPATISAVVFGLNLLHSCLKKMKVEDDEGKMISMMDPFVPMLTACICNCKDNDVALVAMKCVMSLLRFELPSFSKCSKSLGPQALMFLASSGSSLNQNNDMKQACFRTLTYLINRDRNIDDTNMRGHTISGAEGEEVLSRNTTMPLNGEQMKVLISFLTVSIAESDQHNPALSLIRAIVSRRFTSPEFYDLMESLLKVNVRSQKSSLRQQSAGIFIRYLLDYPMSEERFEQHLKQIVANIGYEYKDGRLSAIEMLMSVIEKLPELLLERHAQVLFLPLVLHLVNDESNECREAVSKCLSKLLSRSPTEVLKTFHNYMVRWCNGDGPMQVASLQVLGIFVESCHEFLQSNDYVVSWLERVTGLLQKPHTDDWEVPYFSLICVEKLATSNRSSEQSSSIVFSKSQKELWNTIVERLVDSHPWIKQASGRIVQNLLSLSPDIPSLVEQTPGFLFEIVRNLCFQLNVDEEEQNESLSETAIKSLVLALPMVHRRPDLCFATDSPHAGLRDPIAWLLRRLSAIAKPKGRSRRMAVYKCFAAFGTRHPKIVFTCENDDGSGSDNGGGDNTKKERQQQYLEFMLEPLHRSDLEASNELENPHVLHKMTGMNQIPTRDEETVMTESSLARDVLQLIEEGCQDCPETFLQALAAVKSRARDKREQRKVQSKVEAVQDPAAAVAKKTKKHERERDRKKRRVEDRRRDRGAQKKRRNNPM